MAILVTTHLTLCPPLPCQGPACRSGSAGRDGRAQGDRGEVSQVYLSCSLFFQNGTDVFFF